jgi:DNA-binding beta-propeller fold protein YncE
LLLLLWRLRPVSQVRGHEEFAFPTGIAFDSSDNVYVVEDFGWRVQKFEGGGNFIPSWFSGSFPFDIEIDSSDNVYVSERAAHRVVKFSSDGDMLGWLRKCTAGINCDTDHERSIGFTCMDATCQGLGPGSGDGQFNETRGIAIDTTGNIYIGDQRNSRVQVFDPDGNFLFKFGERGTADCQFINVIGITVDSQGNIYVSDHTDAHIGIPHIQKFDNTGGFIGWLGKCMAGANCDTENRPAFLLTEYTLTMICQSAFKSA